MSSRVFCNLHTFLRSILWLTHRTLKIFKLELCHIHLAQNYLGWTVKSENVNIVMHIFKRILISSGFGGMTLWSWCLPKVVEKLCVSHANKNHAFHIDIISNIYARKGTAQNMHKWHDMIEKLDGVAPLIRDPPPRRLALPLYPIFCLLTCDMWQMTGDRWHVTCDTLQVTHNMWQLEGGAHSVIISAS